jgi:biotin carboxyl carrier protein
VRYFVAVNGHDFEVTLDGPMVRCTDFEGRAHVAELEGAPVRLVTLGDQIYSVVVRRGARAGQYTIRLAGFRFNAEALDERALSIRRLAGTASKPPGASALVAPMPGMIVRVLVQPGDRVQVGQGVIVMEAMKMENELRAPSAGTIETVAVSAGSAVEKGAVLVELAPSA